MLIKEKLQKIIDRIFHRETYDSATVVTTFEEKLAGIYWMDELKIKIVQGLDEIFHFKAFMLNLKNSNQKYQPEYAIGLDYQKFDKEFELSPESDRMLRKSKVFSPGELEQKLAIADAVNAELFVPLVKEDQPFGFFLCGQKKSEKSYSMQDIRVLSLIAKRVIALFQTAQLYQKDLERQLMLERERARISQDMHDDIGAGLTKIAMLSEARIKGPDQVPEVTEKMSKLSSAARDMIARLNVIVWALNPKYDNLDSLVSYIRRYFGEYLDNFGISFKMDTPDVISNNPITPDYRRNAFYAIQEAIHNSVKHGSCSEISLVLNINNDVMSITITDNGRGFDQSKAGSNGNGLINMKKRAEELGGSFDIQSSPGNGTRILFKIKI
jgi:signal transduction histidine kinase